MASSWCIQTLGVRGRWWRRHGAADSQTAGSSRASALTHKQAAAAWDGLQAVLERESEGGGCTSQLNHFSWFILTRGGRVQVVRRLLFILFYCFNLTCGMLGAGGRLAAPVRWKLDPRPPSSRGSRWRSVPDVKSRRLVVEVGTGSAAAVCGGNTIWTLRLGRRTENILKLC